MEKKTFTPPKSEQGGLVKIDFAQTRTEREVGDAREADARHELVVATVLASAVPRVLEQAGIANEKTMRIAAQAVHGDSVYGTGKNPETLTLTSIKMGHQTSKEALRAGMKLAMIYAFVREVAIEIGGAKPSDSDVKKIANDDIWEKRMFVLPLDRIFERWNVNVSEREGVIHAYPGTQDKQAFDSFFTPEEERDLVLLTYVMQERYPVSQKKEQRLYSNLQEQAKRMLSHDPVNDVAYIGWKKTEEGADTAYAQAVARKREIAMMVDELYQKFSDQEPPERKEEKRKNESQSKITELERKNAELAAQLQAANARVAALERAAREDEKWRKETANTARELLGNASMFNSNKARVYSMLKVLYHGREGEK